MIAKVVGHTRDVLGEGPVWCERAQALYWVDIRGKAIRRHTPSSGTTESWATPEVPGSLAVREAGGLIVALRDGIYRFDPLTGGVDLAFTPPGHGAEMRFNDGKCDPQGRFWVGSLNDTARLANGVLYRVDPGQGFVPVLTGITIPNSLCWSPDGRTMYFSDSWLHALGSYAFDPGTGEVGTHRVVTRTEPPAVPDGATVDEDGCIWFAAHDGWEVVRCAPDGRRLSTIRLPVQRPTAVAFGGADLRTLYVTSKAAQLSADELRRQPLAGALFAVDPGVRGRPESRFQG